MKKSLIICFLILSVYCLKAQDGTDSQNGYHQHDGFYLSLNAGPVFGNIMDQTSPSSLPSKMEFSGSGAVFDFKIGGAIRENLILHACLISQGIAGPNIESTDIQGRTTSVKAPDTFGIGEAMYGVGITRYFMPSNIFVSGTVGLGKFSLTDENKESVNGSTDKGFSMQLKLGKEWWLSKNWGMGVSFTYGKTSLTNEQTGSPTEELNSNRFGILLNTTFN